MGYPKTVYFSAEGGIETVHGNEIVTGFHIIDYNGNGVSTSTPYEGGFMMVNDWLSIIDIYTAPSFKVKVEPNSTGKKRRLRICYGHTNLHGEIEVVQYP